MTADRAEWHACAKIRTPPASPPRARRYGAKRVVELNWSSPRWHSPRPQLPDPYLRSIALVVASEAKCRRCGGTRIPFTEGLRLT
jgi:sugar/nucleoside kinase (ribokinase family)